MAHDILLNGTLTFEELHKLIDLSSSQLFAADLTAMKHQSNFYFCAFAQKLLSLVCFDFQVMDRGSDTQANPFDLVLWVLVLLFLLELLHSINIFTEVHDLTDWWMCFWGDLNEVETGFLGQCQSLTEWNDANLLIFIVEKTELSTSNGTIDANMLVYKQGVNSLPNPSTGAGLFATAGDRFVL